MSTGGETAELTLRWEAGSWRASGIGIDLSDPDLAALDTMIVRELARTTRVARAHLRFDMRSLPMWLRQYQAHYFNYVLRIDGGEHK